jgi:Asp-tRNA(Asn)/Glu-tRNA(Gln) amidotransferase A subunit family amidase
MRETISENTNPWDLNRVLGGYRDGSSAPVASGISIFVIGSGIDGFIRILAKMCGVIWFKSSYNLVSLKGFSEIMIPES